MSTLSKLDSKKKRVLILSCIGIGLAIIAIILVLVFAGDATNLNSPNNDFPEDDPMVEAVTVTEWPSEEFPGVPVFDAESYSIIQYKDQSIITLDAAYFAQLQTYALSLASAGAETYATSDYSSVYGLNDIEIQLLFDEETPRIFLCKETTIDFSLDNFSTYPLPESGRLVSETLTNDGLSAFLTYRNASYRDALAYGAVLESYGWTATTPTPAPDATTPFMAVYTLDKLEITIDYHLGSPDYMIYLSDTTDDIGDTEILTDEELEELDTLDPNDVDTNYTDEIDPDAAG